MCWHSLIKKTEERYNKPKATEKGAMFFCLLFFFGKVCVGGGGGEGCQMRYDLGDIDRRRAGRI